MNRQEKWDNRLLELASLIATWSKDPKRKVGCIITDEEHHIVATGYNGLAKQLDSIQVVPTEVKNHLTIHAEINCLANIPAALPNNVTVYVTTPPCMCCARMLVANLDVKRIVTKKIIDHSSSKWYLEMNQAKAYLTEEEGIEYVEY